MLSDDFRSDLRERLLASGTRPLLRIAVGAELLELDGPAIVNSGVALASRLCKAEPGQVVLLLMPHSVELFILHLGLVLLGRVPAILAWPTSRIDPAKYQRNLLHQLRNLPAAQLISLPQLAKNLGPKLPYPTTACEFEGSAAFDRSFEAPFSFLDEDSELVPSAPTSLPDALFLQFSGGTTGAQKAVVVTGPMLADQLERLRATLDFSQADSVVSWLPLYHDMGLIACLWFPLWHGAPSLHMAASDWLLNPGLLFQYVERFQGTFCWLPNFTFSYLAGQKGRIGEQRNLASMRAWVNCSEPVRFKSMMNFVDAYDAWGVRGGQMQASYAMAENVFAVTQTRLGQPPTTVSRADLREPSGTDQDLAFNLVDVVYVSSGNLLKGMELRIGSAPIALSDRFLHGEIQIRGGSLFTGYWGNSGFASSALSDDGWYSTGDYGFLQDDELYVIGRLKDIVIVGGQNVFPEDVEAIVNTVSGIYPGRVVAFGVQDEASGTEALTIVAEMQSDFQEAVATTLQKEIQSLVLSSIGIAPRYVRVKPQRWIVKSTAGKISRSETRARFLEELSNMQSGTPVPVLR